jgi:hypothetical protein
MGCSDGVEDVDVGVGYALLVRQIQQKAGWLQAHRQTKTKIVLYVLQATVLLLYQLQETENLQKHLTSANAMSVAIGIPMPT